MNLPTERQWARYSALCARLQHLPTVEREVALQTLRAQGADDPQVLSLVAVHFALPPAPDRLRTGDRVGNCTLEEPLGAGGMGVVYRAQQHLGPARRPVAVKLIHPALLQTAGEEASARFLTELHTLVMLQHEHIARIYDGGIAEDPRTHEPMLYLAMELVQGGQSLTTYAKDYALSWQERLEAFVRVCHAVRYAHEHRIIHRDLKPANILVDSEGRPVLIDFGLAQACDAMLPGAHLAVSGTPAYMSPEQMADAFGAVSEKSDGYALGLILYELLTGQLPYMLHSGHTVAQWHQVIMEAVPPPLWTYDLAYGADLEAIVLAALAKQPAERISVAVLRSRLVRYLQQWSPPAADVMASAITRTDMSAPPSPVPFALESPTTGLLVGREAELATLHALVHHGPAGHAAGGVHHGRGRGGQNRAGGGLRRPGRRRGGGVDRARPVYRAVWDGRGVSARAGSAGAPLSRAAGAHFLAWLRQHAPSWLAQMPAVLPVAERDAWPAAGRGHHPGPHATGAGRGAGEPDHGAAAAAGAGRPALE